METTEARASVDGHKPAAVWRGEVPGWICSCSCGYVSGERADFLGAYLEWRDHASATLGASNRARLERCVREIEAVRSNMVIGPTCYSALTDALERLGRALVFVLDEREQDGLDRLAEEVRSP